MRPREIVLGDWGPVVRDPVDVARIAFVCAAVGFALAGADRVVNLAVSSAAVVASRLVDLPRAYNLAFVAAMALTGWGDAAGLYETWGDYDRVVHFLVPFAIAPIVYILLARAEALPRLEERGERRHELGILVVTLALGLAIGAVWEIVEWISDHAFGSSLQAGQADTIGDLVADGCGALLGAALLVTWKVFGWATERRRPGE